MAEMKTNITLNEKGQETDIPLEQLQVTLKWTKGVDLDLMAFFKTKDGRTGGVVSEQIPGGTLGSLDNFPYIQHSGDEGIEEESGDNQEQIIISKLDDMAEIFICALNYTDASEGKDVTFSEYDGGVVVLDDKGHSIGIPLDATDKGYIAIIGKINNTPEGPKLVNMNKIIDLPTFATTIPGSDLLVEIEE